MAWIQDGDEIRCTEHETRFAKGESCERCMPSEYRAEDHVDDEPSYEDFAAFESTAFRRANRVFLICVGPAAAPNEDPKLLAVAMQALRMMREIAAKHLDLKREINLGSLVKRMQRAKHRSAKRELD